MHRVLVTFSAVFFAAALTAQSAPPRLETRFAELRQQWAKNLREKKIDASVAEYAADGGFIEPDGTRIRGTDALRKLYETITAAFDSNLVFDSQRVETSGDLAYDSGTYHESLIVRANGKHQLSQGSYLTVYRRNAAGAWLIVEQVWTGTVQ